MLNQTMFPEFYMNYEESMVRLAVGGGVVFMPQTFFFVWGITNEMCRGRGANENDLAALG